MATEQSPLFDHDYEYETEPLFRDSDDERIGTMFFFEDEPLAFGRDESGMYPDVAFIEYATVFVGEELGHEVVKAVADDGTMRLTQAIAFAPAASDRDIAVWWERLHDDI
jgi:hypothetical protein